MPAGRRRFLRLPQVHANTKKSSLEITQALIDEALVVTTPGIAFGAAGEGHVRFSIAERTADLEKMLDRLAKVAPNL